MKRLIRLSTFLTLFLFLVLSLGQLAYAKPAPSTALTFSTPNLTQTVNVGDTVDFKVSVKYTDPTKLTWSPSSNLEKTVSPYKTGKTITEEYRFTASEAGTFPETVTVTDGVKTGVFKATFTVLGPPPAPRKYLALGDSIPYGRYYTDAINYVLGGTNTTSYIEQLAGLMGIDAGNFIDASRSGYNAWEVYGQLASLESAIRAADIISLSVGGNDIMDAAARTLSGLDKHDIDWTLADAGRDSFQQYWPLIIDRIETWNPEVTLIVMTVYNPYHTTDVYNGTNYYNKVDPYFSADDGADPGLNHIIRNLMTLDNSGAYWAADLIADDFDYRVADVYQAFNNYGDGLDDKDAFTGFYRSFCDPHPNQTGQNFIYTQHKVLLSDFQ